MLYSGLVPNKWVNIIGADSIGRTSNRVDFVGLFG
jgi:hypothetical protein